MVSDVAPERLNDRRLPHWLADALWIAAASAILLFVLSTAWARALEPITDTGRDLSIPQQIRDGAKLYRDVRYQYPPLTPYLLAALTAVTGSSLTAYSAIGALVAVLTAAAVFAAGRLSGGPHVGGAAAVMFASGSVYSITGRTANYLFPYTYAITIGMLFFVTAAACLIAYLIRRRTFWLMTSVAFFFAASWTKIEFAGWSFVLLLSVTIIFRVPVMALIAYAVAGCISVAGAQLYFSDAAPERHWLWENVLASSLLGGDTARFFYRQASGFDSVGANLLVAITGVALTAVMAALVCWVSRSEKRSSAAVAAVVMILAVVFGGATFTRGWALLQVALIPLALRRRDPILVLIVLSLCASSRVFLRLFPSWYGFALVVPTLILIAAVLFDFLPRLGLYSRKAALLWTIPIASFCAQLLLVERQLLERKIHRVDSAQGTFYEDNADRAAILNAFIVEIHASPPESLVVIPEGLTLNYLTGVANPLSFHTFTPVETADREVELQIMREMNDRKPEAIAIVDRSVSDFGFRGFGVDYNLELASLIRARYTVAREWRRPGFNLILLRRREGDQPVAGRR